MRCSRADAQLADASSGVVTLDYCCVQDLDGSLAGAGNIGSDPLFRNRLGPDGLVGTADDDLRLAHGSPAVDRGSNDAVATDVLDLDGDGDFAEPLPFDLLRRARFSDSPFVKNRGQGAAPIVDMEPFEIGPIRPRVVLAR